MAGKWHIFLIFIFITLYIILIELIYSRENALQGLKTGMYYLRTKPAVNALQFTVDKSKLRNANTINPCQSSNSESGNEEELNSSKSEWLQNQNNESIDAVLACSRENGDACMACGS